MGDDDDPGGIGKVWGPSSIAISLSSPSQGQSISCKTCLSQFVPIDFRYKHCPSCKAKSVKPKAHSAKRDNSTAFISFQETNPSKLQKDDKDEDFAFQFDSAFELDFEAFISLDRTSLLKLKSFFAKLEEESKGRFLTKRKKP